MNRFDSLDATPLVSVVIPAYNAERHISAAIESVLAQTYRHIEIIIVDDGSRDGTRDVAMQFVSSTISVISQQNRGASAARNAGIARTTGAYVQFLDADDLLSRDKIAEQIRLLGESEPGHVALCDTVYFRDGEDPNAGRRALGYASLNSDDPVQWLVDLWTPGPRDGIASWGMVQPAAWLVPRASILSAGPWDARISVDDDGEYFTRVLLASRGVRWNASGCVYYRQYGRPVSLSGQRGATQMEGRLISVESKVRLILSHAAGSARDQACRALARQFMDVAYHAYPEFADVARRAEQRATALGGYSAPFFEHSRAGAVVERICGWKAARRLSRTFQSLRTR